MPNPVLPVHAADPHLALFGDRYYLYCSDAGVYSLPDHYHAGTPGESGAGFAAWSSADLVDWRWEGMILRFSEVGWAKARDWAPAIATRDGKYYFYFCADDSIGVAVGDTPVGPFQDALGEPLVPRQTDISDIDPMAFIDDDGQGYLYWGAVPAPWVRAEGVTINTALSVRRLRPDMITFDGPALPTIDCGGEESPHIEASFVIKRRGVYYLMWSQGSWDVAGKPDEYHVKYATAPSPLGPWTVAAEPTILSSRPEMALHAPGHHSVLQIPGTEDWVIAYHTHTGDRDRRVWLDRLYFNEDGTIRPVVPTRAGVSAIPH